MRVIHFVLSALIFFGICVPAILISVPVVAVLLLTAWDGRTTIFGNEKWGRANDHFAYPTKTYWEEFNWLVLRNPVNNLHSKYLAITQGFYKLDGDSEIGDKKKGGFYAIRMGRFWEYYWIKPYTVFGSRHCIRVRVGWKIHGNTVGNDSSFVFAVNPWKTYLGV